MLELSVKCTKKSLPEQRLISTSRMVRLDSMMYALSPTIMGLIKSLLTSINIFIYLDDIPVNIYAMQMYSGLIAMSCYSQRAESCLLPIHYLLQK